SYLHVSWETVDDLLSLVDRASAALQTYRRREVQGGWRRGDLFDDLAADEVFPPSHLVVERILEVRDSTIDDMKIDFENAVMPASNSSESSLAVPNDSNKSSEYASAGVVESASKERPPLLHGPDAWVTVKW